MLQPAVMDQESIPHRAMKEHGKQQLPPQFISGHHNRNVCIQRYNHIDQGANSDIRMVRSRTWEGVEIPRTLLVQ
jgi:hypothetical protein